MASDLATQVLGGALKYTRALRTAALRDRPIYAHWGITHRCDITCRMCGIWKHGNEDEELGLPEVARLADVLQELGVIQISIGGGEPFCRRDLPEVIRILHSRGLNVRVLTNAMNLTEREIDAAVEAGLSAVSVSLDTMSKSKFGWICCDEGAWDKVVTNLVRFSEKLPKRGNILSINCVVSRDTLEGAPDLVEFAGKLGYFVSLIPVELAEDPHNNDNKFITYQPKMRLTQDEVLLVDNTYDRLVEMKRQGANILVTTPYLESSRRYFKTGQFPLPCDAGRLYFSINPAGMLTICHRTNEHKSILDADFTEYFRSPEYQAAAKAEADSCEGCVRPCWIDTGYMFKTAQGFVETGLLNVKIQRERHTLPLVEALSCGRP